MCFAGGSLAEGGSTRGDPNICRVGGGRSGGRGVECWDGGPGSHGSAGGEHSDTARPVEEEPRLGTGEIRLRGEEMLPVSEWRPSFRILDASASLRLHSNFLSRIFLSHLDRSFSFLTSSAFISAALTKLSSSDKWTSFSASTSSLTEMLEEAVVCWLWLEDCLRLQSPASSPVSPVIVSGSPLSSWLEAGAGEDTATGPGSAAVAVTWPCLKY